MSNTWMFISEHFLYVKGYSPLWLTSLLNAEKFEFENPAIMEDKQCKQTERFSVMAKGSDNFLSLYKIKINNIQ